MPIDLKELVRDAGELVSFPEVYQRVAAVIDDPRTSAADVAAIIGQDPALTVRLLRIANSPLHGLSGKVDSVVRAISVMGLQRLRELVLASSASTVLTGIPNEMFVIEDFWQHSIYCGLAAQYLAEYKGIGADFIFVAGLLHDIGQLVLFNRFPGQVQVALELSMHPDEGLEMYQAERKVFGFDHAQLGGELLCAWHLPVRLQECVRYHHDPAGAESYPVEAAIVHIANAVANMVALGEITAERIDPRAWAITGLEWGVIDGTVQDAEARISQVRAELGLG